MLNSIQIHEKDNVMVALSPIAKESKINVSGKTIIAQENIPQGHKIAICDIKAHENILKYGIPIGHATQAIKTGEWVHIHNTKTNLSDLLEYNYCPELHEPIMTEHRYFQGYNRPHGKVATRNEVWIIPTVGCVNNIVSILAEKMKPYALGKVDDLHGFQHPYGCSQMGDDQIYTQKALAALIEHPNAGAVLVVGLGCENNHIQEQKKYLSNIDESRIKFLECQNFPDELEEGAALLAELIDYASQFKREPIDTEHLVIGLKCGGSDGLSGITANPLVGSFSDLLISKGGTTILTEVPEMFGAETLLMNRCKNESIFMKLVNLINDFKLYYQNNNQVIYENPSPGNKNGGITTLEDKSLGCIQKGGSATIVDALGYGQSVSKKGLNILESPGNDLVASTALALSGAHIVLFTTGRGTPFGSPVPTVKISSNSQLYASKSNWIDFDAGKLVTGFSLSQMSESLLEYVIKIASGEKTLSEKYHCKDFSIFKRGVTL